MGYQDDMEDFVGETEVSRMMRAYAKPYEQRQQAQKNPKPQDATASQRSKNKGGYVVLIPTDLEVK